MALPRGKGCPVGEKAAVDRHFASLNLFVRLLDELHGFSSFFIIGGTMRLRKNYTISDFVFCQFLSTKEEFLIISNLLGRKRLGPFISLPRG